MPKYLWEVTYTLEGVQGVMKEGGSGRRDMVEQLVAKAGGTLEAFYFTFGGSDAVVIAELPDDATAAAVSLTVGASGAASLETTVLLTPEQIDQAKDRTIAYRPPGA